MRNQYEKDGEWVQEGVPDVHIVVETDQPGRILNEVAAFRAFSADIEARCDEPPTVTEITLVGSYGVR